MPLSRRGLASGIVIGLTFAGVASADEPTKQECVAANETAQDLQRAGKLVEARAPLRTCAAKACPRAVRQDCSDRLEAVEKALPSVVLIPKDAAGQGVLSAAALSVDGATWPDALDGTPVPVDPGPHTFTIALSGHSPVSLRISLGQGEQVRREIVLKPLHAADTKAGSQEAAGDASPPDGQAAAASPAGSEGPSSRTSPLRLMGWSALGAGVAGVALGSLFGIAAIGNKSSLSSACGAGGCPPTSGHDIDHFYDSASAADICFVIGGLGLGAGGVILLLTQEKPVGASAPHPQTALQARPWIGPGDVGVTGTFR